MTIWIQGCSSHNRLKKARNPDPPHRHLKAAKNPQQNSRQRRPNQVTQTILLLKSQSKDKTVPPLQITSQNSLQPKRKRVFQIPIRIQYPKKLWANQKEARRRLPLIQNLEKKLTTMLNREASRPQGWTAAVRIRVRRLLQKGARREVPVVVLQKTQNPL